MHDARFLWPTCPKHFASLRASRKQPRSALSVNLCLCPCVSLCVLVYLFVSLCVAPLFCMPLFLCLPLLLFFPCLSLSFLLSSFFHLSLLSLFVSLRVLVSLSAYKVIRAEPCFAWPKQAGHQRIFELDGASIQ